MAGGTGNENRGTKESASGLLFISPWIAGFLLLCLYPLLSTFVYSLCDYSVLSPAVFVGAQNYRIC